MCVQQSRPREFGRARAVNKKPKPHQPATNEQHARRVVGNVASWFTLATRGLWSGKSRRYALHTAAAGAYRVIPMHTVSMATAMVGPDDVFWAPRFVL